MSENAVVTVEGAKFKFGDNVAVDAVSLEIKKGEIFGVVGPDGAGKTTLIRMALGLLDPCEGNISTLGFDSKTQKKEINKRVGYLSQKFSLYGDLTIDENIDFFAEIHGVKKSKERKKKLLEFTRLAPFRKRLADKLSGGMKQKLALACTLIHTPEIIFLDEPTTGVDPVSRRDFWKILNELLAGGLSIVVSTPYLDEAERAGSVALMNKGKILALDAPKKIRASIPYKFAEVVCSPVREAYAAAAGLKGALGAQMFGDRIHAAYDDALTSPRLIAEGLEAAGITVSMFRQISPSLEDVFLDIIGKG